MLPRYVGSPLPRPLPRHRVVAIKPTPSRASACNAPRHSHVPAFSYGCLFYRSSVTPLDLHVEVILVRRSHSRSAVTITLYDFWQCLRVAPSTSSPSSTPPYPAAHHQERGSEAPSGFFLRSFLPLPPFPLPSRPPAFLPQVAGPKELARIVDAICGRSGEMMLHRNWAVRRCLEVATGSEERRKIVACMRGRIVDLATNYYGYYVLQKALDCKEEEVRLLIVSGLLRGDPATTLANKHSSHVWSKITELSWAPPALPIFCPVIVVIWGAVQIPHLRQLNRRGSTPISNLHESA
ncbi:hypothetical protein B0H13DRAFT_1873253 [Mycena leptocephala]|nr:hypothetical protein B0H13DRAFT_1873253 [Mycena leptocephala]